MPLQHDLGARGLADAPADPKTTVLLEVQRLQAAAPRPTITALGVESKVCRPR